MKQIKILIVLLFAVLSLQAQTSATIRPAAKLNVSVASGSDPYTLTVAVLDDLSRFSFSDFGVGDSVYLIDGSDLLIYVVTSKLTSPNRLVVDDVNNTGISAPTGQGAIVKSTPNYKLPFYISGLRDDLRSMMMNRLSQLLDSNIATAGGEIYRYVGTSGVAPAVTAAAAGTITAQNTVGEIYTWNPATNLSSGSWSIISGGGGSLTANSVDSTHIKPASIAASDAGQSLIDTIKILSNINNPVLRADSTYFFGNSITFGSASSNNAYRWTSIVSKLLRTTEVNNGVAGSSIIKDATIPNNIGGGTMIDRLSTIPAYTSNSTSKQLVFSFGANDIGMGAQTGWDTAAFKRDYRTIINNAKTKGWTNSKIAILSPAYIKFDGFVTYNAGGRPLSNDTRTQQFVAACSALASEYSGIKYIDLYAPTKSSDTLKNYNVDGLHPNDFGHKLMAQIIYTGLGIDSVLTSSTATIKLNGGADIQGLAVRNLQTVKNGFTLAIDSLGKVGFKDENIDLSQDVITIVPSAAAAAVAGVKKWEVNDFTTGQLIKNHQNYISIQKGGTYPILEKRGLKNPTAIRNILTQNSSDVLLLGDSAGVNVTNRLFMNVNGVAFPRILSSTGSIKFDSTALQVENAGASPKLEFKAYSSANLFDLYFDGTKVDFSKNATTNIYSFNMNAPQNTIFTNSVGNIGLGLTAGNAGFGLTYYQRSDAFADSWVQYNTAQTNAMWRFIHSSGNIYEGIGTSTVGTNAVYNANGNRGFGKAWINGNTPAYIVDIDASAGTASQPMRVKGLQAGSTSDSIVSSNAGVLKRTTINDMLGTTTSSLRVPRLTTTQRDALNGAAGSVTGDVIYNSTTGTYQVGSVSSAWLDVNTTSTIKVSNDPIAIPSITGMTTGFADQTVTGAAVGNTVIVNPRTDITADNVILGGCYVVSTNTVRIIFFGTSVGTNGAVTRNFDIQVNKN